MIVNINNSDVGINNLSTLIRKLSFIFNYEGKNVPNCEFKITATKLDAVSALVIFKAFDFASKYSCLESPKANLNNILKLFSIYGIENLMKKLVNQEEADGLYNNLKPSKTADFFIAPHPINRESFKNKQDLENKYTQFIADYYQNICPELVQYFKTCICEIASNFLYHALEDNNSILMAQGNKKKIEIVCVDNSKGILTTLNPDNKDHFQVMRSAFQRGVTSKKDEFHCGTGLWYIEKIAQQLNGTLRVYSEDMLYVFKDGKVFVKKSPYWKGSIFYLKLNILKNTKIDDFFAKFNNPNKLDLFNTQ
ncbi:ATP-binding protein [Flavivirga jejuensis]|uniref:ATP-binding protein n=1 Tax=Flavivirga jejuensis TaxID=870487 RepID=A0ABT8WMR4_9FLAO|nr:ATP-binding protein [Flavivirga jejuensis]MDO5974445.1 ATP-binding protein [Flavivirga jejuensis]